MNEAVPERIPQTQPSFSVRTPGPPKITGPDLQDQPNNPDRTVYLLDPMPVRDLASALHLKPFKILADLMELKLFKSPDDLIDFETASLIVRKHAFKPERPPPGTLVL
jgi:hypothetical protein